MGIRYSAIPGHTTELARALNEVLSADWRDLRGVEIVSFGVNSIAASQEDEQMIKDLQKAAVMRDPTMAAANIASAQSDAMRAAAANPNGAMAGFMGMGMAGGMGGMNASQLFAAGQAQQQQAMPAADFKNGIRVEVSYGIQGIFQPLPHFIAGNGVARAGAFPEGEVFKQRHGAIHLPVCFLIYRGPLPDSLPAFLFRHVRLPARPVEPGLQRPGVRGWRLQHLPQWEK